FMIIFIKLGLTQNISQTLISTVHVASPLLPKGKASAFPSERYANAERLVEKGEVQRPSRTRYRYANGKSRRCYFSCMSSVPLW
ncbi:MAG: hypothetical protein ACYTX0_49060, partial [Nostoc sp.]